MFPRSSLLLIAFISFPQISPAQALINPKTDALGDPLPEGAIARLGTLRFKHAPELDLPIAAASFSADGKMIVSRAGVEGSIRLWDADTGREIPGPWNAAVRGYAGMAISPDNSILATAVDAASIPGKDGQKVVPILLWSIKQAKQLQSLEGHPNFIRALAFADGGKTVVSAGNGAVCWFEVATSKLIRTWKPFEKEERAGPKGRQEQKFFINPSLAPDGKHLIVEVAWRENESSTSGGGTGELIGFDLASGSMRWRTTGKVLGRLPRFAFSGDGKRVAIPNAGDKLEIRDTSTGKLVPAPQETAEWITGPINSLALDAKGDTAAMGGSGSKFVLWNVDGKAAPRKLEARSAGRPIATQAVCFSPDDKRLLVCVNTELQIYDVVSLKAISSTEGQGVPIGQIAFSKDGATLRTSSFSNVTIKSANALKTGQVQESATWDVTTGKRLKWTPPVASPWPNFGAANPQETVYVGKDGDDRFGLFDMSSGKLLGRLAVSPDQDSKARGFFSTSGGLYVLASKDEGKLIDRIFSVPTGKFLCAIPSILSTSSSNSVEFSSNDRLAAILCRDDGLIHVVETSTGTLRQKIGGMAEKKDFIPATFMAFSHDGMSLATWNTTDRVPRVWDLATGKERFQIPSPGVAGNVPSNIQFAWSPDGRTLAVAESKYYSNALLDGRIVPSLQSSIQLWEIASLSIRRELSGHHGVIRAMTYSPNGWLAGIGRQ